MAERRKLSRLNDKQREFCRLLHQGVEMWEAYRDGYGVIGPPGTLRERAKEALMRPAVAAELARLDHESPSPAIRGLLQASDVRLFLPEVQNALTQPMTPLRIVPDHPLVDPGAEGDPDAEVAPEEQPVRFLPRIPGKARYSDDWFLAILDMNAARAMQVVPVLDAKGNPTGEYTYAGAVANKALEIMARIKGSLVDRRELTVRTVDRLSDDELRQRRAEVLRRLQEEGGEVWIP